MNRSQETVEQSGHSPLGRVLAKSRLAAKDKLLDATLSVDSVKSSKNDGDSPRRRSSSLNKKKKKSRRSSSVLKKEKKTESDSSSRRSRSRDGTVRRSRSSSVRRNPSKDPHGRSRSVMKSGSSKSSRRHSMASRIISSPDKVLRVALKPSMSHGSTVKKEKVLKLSAAKLPLLWAGDESLLSRGSIVTRKKTKGSDKSATSNKEVAGENQSDVKEKKEHLPFQKSESIESLGSASIEVFQMDATDGSKKEQDEKRRAADEESIQLEVISSDESDRGSTKGDDKEAKASDRSPLLKREEKKQDLGFHFSSRLEDDENDDSNSVSTRERKDTLHMLSNPTDLDMTTDRTQDDAMEEVDYYRSPTMLSRLIQFQKYEEALLYLEDHPNEASIWMVARRKKAVSPMRSKRMREKKRLNREGKSLFEPESEVKRKVHSYSSNSTASSAISTTLTLRQLPLHIACQQFALIQQHDPNNLVQVLEELLTQLLVICPQACRVADHTGMYCIHYLVQYRASPELINIALMTFPEGANKKDPIGRSLEDLFYSTSPLPAEGVEESDRILTFKDRAKVRKEDAILELLEYDSSFWEMALQETSMMRSMQQTWKKAKNIKPSKSSKHYKFRAPWELAKEREDQMRLMDDTERTADESLTQTTWDDSAMFSSGLASSAMLSSGMISSEMISTGLISYDSGMLEEENAEEDYEGAVPATAWTILEQRTLMLEKLLLESTQQNYDLQNQLRGVSDKREASGASKIAEMAKEAFDLRRQNASLSNELNVIKKRLLAQQGQGQSNDQNMQRASTVNAAAASSEVSSATTLRDSIGSNLNENSSYDFSDSSGLDALKQREGLKTKSLLPGGERSPVAEVEIKLAEVVIHSDETANAEELRNKSESGNGDIRKGMSAGFRVLEEKHRVQQEAVDRLEAKVDALLGKSTSREHLKDNAVQESQSPSQQRKVACKEGAHFETGQGDGSQRGSLADTLKKTEVARLEIEESIRRAHEDTGGQDEEEASFEDSSKEDSLSKPKASPNSDFSAYYQGSQDWRKVGQLARKKRQELKN